MYAPLGRIGLRLLWTRRALRFRAALHEPERAQRRVLRAALAAAARTEYGRHCGVTGAETYGEFSRRVPIVDYETMAPWIERQARLGGAVVTADPPVVYEQTSGSSGRRKLIPYTPALLRSFNACFVVWAHDLLAHGPGFETGRLYCSISPAFPTERATPSGVPLGFEDDRQYLSPLTVRLLGPGFVTSSGLTSIADPAAFRLALAASLLAEPRLEIVSVWSPTYLLTLLDAIVANRVTIARALRRGEMHADGRRIEFSPAPAARVRLLLEDPIPWQQVWPELKLLSCWTDGSSAVFVGALRRAFPTVTLQGKGLLATEGPVTVPLLRAPAPVPLLDEVVIELENQDGHVIPLHHAVNGRTYGVILTQRGGLTRYRMHDHVAVDGVVDATPCLRFLGRDTQVSDLVGEKLNEIFVRGALRHAAMCRDGFAALVPVAAPEGPVHYVCITDEDPPDGADRAAAVEAELQRAFQYRQARLLDQLGPVTVLYRRDARVRFERVFLRRGMRWGDIKLTSLLSSPTPTEIDDLCA